jgi:hypothetical protein
MIYDLEAEGWFPPKGETDPAPVGRVTFFSREDGHADDCRRRR